MGLTMNFRQLTEMAVDASDFEGGFHPSKRRRVEGEPLDVERLFPDLGPEAERYLEHITSAGYKDTVKRVSRYLNVDVSEMADRFPDINSFALLMGQTIMSIDAIEQHYREDLEVIALNVVLSLPEFTMIKQMYAQGQIKFDIKLLSMGDQQEITDMLFGDDEAPEDGLAPSEELAMQSDRFDSDEDIKREFANFMMAGNAVNKFYLFHLVEDQLNQLNPQLVPKYGLISALGNLGYYMLPDHDLAAGGGAGGAAGVEKVDREKNIIYVRGLNFTLLIHELVKGIWEYLSVDVGSPGKFGAESVNDEVVHIMSGPEVYRQFQSMIPEDKMGLLPLIYKLLLQEPVKVIQTILLGGSRAQIELTRIIQQAESDMGEYEDFDENED